MAVGIRSGVPRATIDVDFAIPTSADRSRLADRLAERGFRLVGEFAHSINQADIALLEGDVPDPDEGW